jgi:hypothetical protein
MSTRNSVPRAREASARGTDLLNGESRAILKESRPDFRHVVCVQPWPDELAALAVSIVEAVCRERFSQRPGQGLKGQ